MSVGIPPAPSVPGVLPQPTITSDGRLEGPGASTTFNAGSLLRNAGIGAGVGAAIGGVTLLGKFALPFIGKATSAMGILKFAGIGGAIGAATIAGPALWDATKDKPGARSALVGAGVGAIAGAILPIIPTWLGAIAGAAVGMAIHASRRDDGIDVPRVPGFETSSGWVPVGRVPIGHGSGVGGPDVPVPMPAPSGVAVPQVGVAPGTEINEGPPPNFPH